jgi:hypothetical protein
VAEEVSGRGARVVLATSAIFLAGCEQVDSHFDTRADLEASTLIEKGWMPDVLPPTARDIEEGHNIDMNNGAGSFEFAAQDSGWMLKSLTPGTPLTTNLRDWADIRSSFRKKGYSAWSFRENDYVWFFFCSEQDLRCDYYMMPDTRQVSFEEKDRPAGISAPAPAAPRAGETGSPSPRR